VLLYRPHCRSHSREGSSDQFLPMWWQMLGVNLQGTFNQLLMLSDTQFIENVSPLSPPVAACHSLAG